MKTVVLHFENRSTSRGFMVNVDAGLPIPAVGDIVENTDDGTKPTVAERAFTWRNSVPIIRYRCE
jgi:hypothetical protein